MSKSGAVDEILANLPHGTIEAVNADQTNHSENKMSREDLVKNHLLAMEELDHQGGIYIPVQAALPTPYIPSLLPCQGLKQVYVRDLRPNTHHHGVYVLLRAITPPLRMAATILIVEDGTGDVVKLQLYKLGEDILSAVDVIPEGRVCIIKEPWYKMMVDGGYGIRVDHVSDVLWLPKADERMPLKWRPRSASIEMTATEMKNNGNDASKMGKLLEAIEW